MYVKQCHYLRMCCKMDSAETMQVYRGQGSCCALNSMFILAENGLFLKK